MVLVLLSCARPPVPVAVPEPAVVEAPAPVAQPAPLEILPAVAVPEGGDIPDGVLDPSVRSVVYSVRGMGFKLKGWIRMAVRLPQDADLDDLRLMTEAHPVALAPEALSTPEGGTHWAVFRVPEAAPDLFTLYAGDEPHPFRAQPIRFNVWTDITWRIPRSFVGCTPGAWVAQEVALSFYPYPEHGSSHDRQRPQGWGPDGGTARWQVRFPCPAPREGEAMVDGWKSSISQVDWAHVEDVASPVDGDWSCVGDLVEGVKFDLTVGSREEDTQIWDLGDPDAEAYDKRFPCDAELKAALPAAVRDGGGRWRADWVARSVELPDVPPLEPPAAIPLVLPAAPVDAARVAQRDLVDHFDMDVVDLLWDNEWRPPLPGADAWPACGAAERAAAEAAMGELQLCTASAGLVNVQYGPPQDCPAGCFYEKAVGRVVGGAFEAVSPDVWRWLRSPQEDVLHALFVPWIVGGNDREGLRVWCRSREPVEARGTDVGRVGRAVFDGDEDCLISWDVEAPTDADGRKRRHGVVMELGVSGRLWVADDGFMDGSELTFHPGRTQYVTWTQTESDHRRILASRRAVVGRPESPAGGTLCETPNIRGDLPSASRVCGGAQGPRMVGVVGMDGHVSDMRILSPQPLDPAWETCAREAVMAAETTPGGCFALPFARPTH